MKAILVFAVCGCTSLGPMAATTGVSAIPNGRPGVDGTFGAVPGFYASRSAQNQSSGAGILELAAMFEPDRWVVPGLIVGGRIIGQDKDTPAEPMLGYRMTFGGGLSMLGIVYGAAKRASAKGASYHGVQYGSEVALDAQIVDTSWLTLHAQAAGNVMRVLASGTYCVDQDGIAKDCDTDPAKNTMISGRMSGMYPAATLTVGADLFRKSPSFFHGVRFAFLITMGEMPLVKSGVQQDAKVYQMFGLTLTLGLGAAAR